MIALLSGFRGAVSAPAVPTMLMLGVIGGSLTATGDALFPTMVAIIVVCSLATGACALLIAHFRLANLVRFIPYPVSSGFVAGTGGIACWLALSLMGIRPEPEALTRLFEPLVAANWGVGLAYGLGLYFATQRWNSFLLMPVSFLLVAVLCHIGLLATGTSAAEAGAAGFLFAGLSDAQLWPPVALDDVARVDWTAVAAQVPNILTLVLVTLLCVVIYTGGLEVASNRELDWNGEFRAIGLGGALAGLGGGPPSCPVVPTSLRSLMFRVDLRSTGVIAGLVMASPLLFGDAVFRLVPVPLMGGVLLFTGIALLDQWLLKVRKRVPPVDYAVIVAMFLTILFFGFFEGVALGMGIVVIAFVVRMSRAGVIDSTFTARDVRSNKTRSVPDRVIVRAAGARVRGYRLKGYLFFGGGQPLADGLKASLDEDPRPLCVLLDFTAVTGFDFSSVNAMCRFILAARGTGTEVVIAAAPDGLADELRGNLPPPVFGQLVFAADADLALEHCEDRLIEAHVADEDARESRSTLLAA
ncbi:MAG: SulP family inorganic anion transporter, partial [Gammaproteobacteria bacterium]|nr:SulP family inorganic anion transporter [Gammaproteobacteria bacterium]